jgi:hypothetical protein
VSARESTDGDVIASPFTTVSPTTSSHDDERPRHDVDDRDPRAALLASRGTVE